MALPPAILSRFDLIHVMIDEPDDGFDYNLAAHIVSVHQKRSEALTPAYTNQQLQRYINYARHIKPTLRADAAAALKQAYVRLRSNDVGSGQSFAYRMTVRQLESMIRLSEALARVHCEFEVTPVHVMEAERLLKTSIITVEAHDVDLARAPMPASLEAFVTHGQAVVRERMAQAVADGAADDDNDNDGAAGGDGEGAAGVEVPTSVPYQKFREMTDMVVTYLDGEEKRATGVGADAGPFAGCKQADLMRWYMDAASKAGAFTSIEAMTTEYLLLQRVLEYLIHNEKTLVIVDEPAAAAGGVDDDGSAEAQEAAIAERTLALNPNYVFE